MPGFAYTPVTFNGITISTFAASSGFLLSNGPLSTRPVGPIESDIPGLGVRDVRGQPKASTLRLLVNLLDVQEATLQAFYKCFSEEAGTQYLTVLDGSSVTWRGLFRVVGIEPKALNQHEVMLRFADPRWAENALTTNSQLNKQTSPINFTLTNNGNRQMRPLFTVTADAAKTGTGLDFGLALQGYIVNRGPNDIVNKPVFLFDVNGNVSRINTAGVGLASGDDCRV